MNWRNIIEGAGWILLAIVVLPFALMSILIRKIGSLILFGCLPLLAVETLTFDASSSPQVGYLLKWGTNAAGMTGFQALDTNRVVVLTNGPWGSFYFKVVAVASNGVESLPSNALLATNLPAAPLQLRLVLSTNVVFLDGTDNAGFSWRRLAIISNKPVILSAQRMQMLRASSPPLPRGQP